jgi:hypothetical protein
MRGSPTHKEDRKMGTKGPKSTNYRLRVAAPVLAAVLLTTLAGGILWPKGHADAGVAAPVTERPSTTMGWVGLDVTTPAWETDVKLELTRLGHPDPDRAVHAIAAARSRSMQQRSHPQFVSRLAPAILALETANSALTGFTQQSTSCGLGRTTNVLIEWQGAAWATANWYGLSIAPPFSWAAGPSFTYGPDSDNWGVAFISVPIYQWTTSVSISTQLLGPWVQDIWCT